LRTPQSAKSIGRTLENRTLGILLPLWGRMKRQGTSGYSKAHPDLVDPGDPTLPTVHMVVTQDRYQYPVASIDLRLLVSIIDPEKVKGRPLVVQCKYRSTTFVGSLLKDLKKAWP